MLPRSQKHTFPFLWPSFSAIVHRKWLSHVLEDFPVDKQPKKIPPTKLMRTVVIIICSQLASQIGCVAHWRRRPQQRIMWGTKMCCGEQANDLFIFELRKWLMVILSEIFLASCCSGSSAPMLIWISKVTFKERPSFLTLIYLSKLKYIGMNFL